jgi:STE24 endopeptidase
VLRAALALALLLEPALGVAADLLNLRVLRVEVPAAFRERYDAESYHRAQQHLRSCTRLGWWQQALMLAVGWPFLFAGGLSWLHARIVGLGAGQVGGGLLLFGLLALARATLAVPFAAWATFVLEARLGFNRTRWGTFWLDRLKAALLAALLGGVLLAAVLTLLVRLGPSAWWLCWVVVAGVTLLVQYLAPRLILPLFSRLTPLPDGEVRAAVLALLRRADFDVRDVLVMDGSRRSTRSNAFFTGLGRQRRIVLFDTLIDQHPLPELLAVIAHETGHARLGHIPLGTALGLLQLAAGLWLMARLAVWPALPAAMGIAAPSLASGLLLGALLLGPLELVAGVLRLALARRWESAADRYAARLCGDPAALGQALVRLAVNNLANLEPHRLWVWLNASHPPLPERVAALGGGERS